MTIATPTRTHLDDGLGNAKLQIPAALIVFGITGDLAARKLIPAVYTLFRGEHLPPQFTFVGVGRRDWTDEQLHDHIRKSLREHAPHDYNDEDVERLLQVSTYAKVTLEQTGSDSTNLDEYHAMRERLEQLDQEHGTAGNRLFYLAIAPEYYATVAANLGAAGLNKSDGFTRIIVEKPFGTDLESAKVLNTEFRAVFDESQIYRIDHYLGKETVQNIAVFRFGNAIFEPIWNRHYIDHVEITVAESVSVGSRGGFYDKAGALRDILQNHALQVLSMVAMEPPVKWDGQFVRDEKVKLLRAIKPIQPAEAFQHSVRGQYKNGTANGKEVKAYLQTEQVAPDSRTETYAALELKIENWRWAGVPFYLRTGKALKKRITEIVIEFRCQPSSPFGDACSKPNRLLIQVQPDEGITLEFNTKEPGQNIQVQTAEMEFTYRDTFKYETAEAYERLLLDAMEGNNNQFTRNDEVEAAWAIMTPFLQGWAQSTDPLPQYEPGTDGPTEADTWIQSRRTEWRAL